MRRLITRAIGLVPSLAVAIAAGRGGVDTLLVASQVALSIVLPFIVFPLLYLTGSDRIMTVDKVREEDAKDDVHIGMRETADLDLSPTATRIVDEGGEGSEGHRRDVEGAVERVSFANGRVVNTLGWLLWIILVAANVYAIVTLGLGES